MCTLSSQSGMTRSGVAVLPALRLAGCSAKTNPPSCRLAMHTMGVEHCHPSNYWGREVQNGQRVRQGS